MKNLRILFFGGNFFNHKIAQNCEKLGAKCFFADMNSECYASKKKRFVNIDFNDRKKILGFIKKNKINFLYITQSDIGIRTLGYLNSKLNLPGINYSIAKNLTHKGRIREILYKNNFSQPKFIVTKNIKKIKNFISQKKEGCIIKPVDSSGSRGIAEIKKKDSLINLVNKALLFSRQKEIIVEEKIKGMEFGAQTFSIDGKCKYVYLHNDYMSKKNNKIPIGHSMPFSLIKNKKKILEIKKIISKAVEVFKIKNGPCNVDCILDKKDKLFILEISPRLGATCLTQILKIYTGVDWDIHTIKLLNGLKIGMFKEKKINVVAKVFESDLDGFIEKIYITKKFPYTKTVIIPKKNEQIFRFTDGSKLFGYVVAHGKDYSKVMKNVNLVIKSLRVKLKKV